jgi:Zn-dependent peptidase ImmA (M78 family)
VALRAGGLCDFSEAARQRPEDQRIEVYCNRVAGAVLVPRRELLEEPVVRQHGRSHRWSDDELSRLSTRFGASRESVLRRLLILGRTTESFYRERRELFLREYQREQERLEGGPSPDKKALSRVGPAFARLVLAGYNQERITSSRLSDYLEVSLKYVPKIEGMLWAQPQGA